MKHPRTTRFTYILGLAGLLIILAACGSTGPAQSSASSPSTTSATAASSPAPTPHQYYVHMNGQNYFAEAYLTIHPGDTVIWIDQDTDDHFLQTFDPATGKTDPTISGTIKGTNATKANPIGSLSVTFKTAGVFPYYCTIHSVVRNTLNTYIQPIHPASRAGEGFAGAMEGIIVVTNDATVEPFAYPTLSQKIVPHLFDDKKYDTVQ